MHFNGSLSDLPGRKQIAIAPVFEVRGGTGASPSMSSKSREQGEGCEWFIGYKLCTNCKLTTFGVLPSCRSRTSMM